MKRKAYLDSSVKDQVLPMLKIVLAILRAQYLSYQTSHWQTSGPAYYGNHLLFQRLYEGVQEEIDALGEKLVGYFGIEAVDLEDSLMLISEMVGRWHSHGCHFCRGLASEGELQDALFIVRNSWPNEHVPLPLGLDDWLAATANAHESNAYLLQQVMSAEGLPAMPSLPKTASIALDLPGYFNQSDYPKLYNFLGAAEFDSFIAELGGKIISKMNLAPVLQKFGIPSSLKNDVADLASVCSSIINDDQVSSRMIMSSGAPSAEGHFFDNPRRRETREFAESGAPTNVPAVGKDFAKEHGNGKVMREVSKTPPTPEEIIEDQPGSAGASTLSRLVVKSKDPEIAPAAKANKPSLPESHKTAMRNWLRELSR
jgi:hypothetical protein